jgi:GTP-binding protein HflX
MAVQAVAVEGLGVDEIREWLRELIPGPAKPRELEWWELPDGVAPKSVTA